MEDPRPCAGQEPSIGLEELPNELLVYIFSFLPTSRDIVKLRYVSRKIRGISQVPSLWNKFLWPWYSKHDERSLNEALEVCGTHVKRLVYPDIFSCCQQHEWDDLTMRSYCNSHKQYFKETLFMMASSTALEMLRHCCNVTKVTLGICLNGDAVKKILEEMKHIKKLDICSSVAIPTPNKSIIAAAGCGNLNKLVLRDVVADDIEHCLSEWVHVGFQPPHLSIFVHKVTCRVADLLVKMLQPWPQWNSQIPADRTAHFKLYFTVCNLWDTSSVAPLFQLEFGQTAKYPFVKASDFGLFGFGEDLLLLTNSSNNGKVVHKASLIQSDEDGIEISSCIRLSGLRCNVSSLSFLTEFTATRCGLLSGHLEQLSIVCPNLERLALRGNTSCLESLQGLRNIVDHCHNLQGVNLEGIHAATIQNCIELWEVLSEIKMLNHLRIELCTFMGTEVCSQQSLYQLALKFACLKQLELMDSSDDYVVPLPPCLLISNELHQACLVFLSHLPSLVSCFAETDTVKAVVDIITKCKHLKYFKYHWTPYYNVQSLLAAPNNHLQYMYINSQIIRITKAFMDSVSAHGKLEVVLLNVYTVTEAGITALIENSPKLYLFKIHFYQKIGDKKHKQLKALKDMLQRDFSHRKLFHLDGFMITGCVPRYIMVPIIPI